MIRLTGGTCVPYRLANWGDFFTPRQLMALTIFSDLVGEAMARVRQDVLAAGLPDNGVPLRDGGRGATAYAEAVGAYLTFAVDKISSNCNSVSTWHTDGEKMQQVFARQAIPMV
ncbi:MAG: hypothetical protein ACUVSW_17560 [Roseiflexus sp.]